MAAAARLGLHLLGGGQQPPGVLGERGGGVQGLGDERRHLARVEADRLQQLGELDHAEQLGLDALEELGGVEGAGGQPCDRVDGRRRSGRSAG